MSKNIKLLLTENVDSLGIVGDVVNVRVGYARNFLLPRELATTPSDEMIKAVASKRAEAQKQLAELRKQREAVVEKLKGLTIELVRSCNDLGHLYGAVTQQEIAKALNDAGYPLIRPRDVRLNMAIKRVDHYDVHIKFESDLDSTIKLNVKADRKLDLDKAREDAEAATKAHEEAQAEARGESADAKGEAKPEGKKSEAKGDAKAAEAGDKPKADKPKKEKGTKGDKGAAKDEPKAVAKGGFRSVAADDAAAMAGFFKEMRPRREKRD